MIPFPNFNFTGNYPPCPPNNTYNIYQNQNSSFRGKQYPPNTASSYNSEYQDSFQAKEEPEYNPRSSNDSIDFFGIRLAQDDLIILGLLFFLYNEKVDDTFLFIILILLLLS